MSVDTEGMTMKGHLIAAVLLTYIFAPHAADAASTKRRSVTPPPPPARSLAATRSWYYMINPPGRLTGDDRASIAASAYDLIVLDSIVTTRDQPGFDLPAFIAQLHARGKKVVAYIDIGQAERWRSYWDSGWANSRGQLTSSAPGWIVDPDPDGWDGNYQVEFWSSEWQTIWLDPQSGYLRKIADAGFDGFYLDWIEAYSHDAVIKRFAGQTLADKTPAEAMVRFIERIHDFRSPARPGLPLLVIAQNAAELAARGDALGARYRLVLDAEAQEQVWFDGGAVGDASASLPQGDCPLPRTDAETPGGAKHAEYLARLDSAPGCRALYNMQVGPKGDQTSTLQVSSISMVENLLKVRKSGLPVFTVDYALSPVNINWVARAARTCGFVSFTSNRPLSRINPAQGASDARPGTDDDCRAVAIEYPN